MKRVFTTVLRHPLFAGSALMIIGSNGASVLNYIYHLVMGRLLSPVQYGELSAIFSLITLMGIIPQSFNLLIVKFISEANGKKEIKGLINWFGKRVVIFATSLFVVIALFSGKIASFLNIQDYLLIVLSGIIVIFSLQSFLNRSVLQGLLKFKEIITSIILENGVKLVAGIVFVYLGFSVLGAMYGLIMATGLAWIVTHGYLSNYRGSTEEAAPPGKEILSFSLPVLIQSAAYASLISSDLILVKHFLPPVEAGIYAAVATLGKIIFFATGPVSAVMIPLIAKRKSQNENYNQIFLLSLGINIFVTLVAVPIFFLLPDLTVSLLYGNKYLEASRYLGPFALFMTFYTISLLFINFFLVMNKTRIVILPFLAAIAQITGILLFHENLMSVVYISIVVTGALVVSLSIFYFKNHDDVSWKSQIAR